MKIPRLHTQQELSALIILCLLLNFLFIGTAFSADPPKVPFIHAKGLQKFKSMCSMCHGNWGQGTKMGPPLMHPFYKPSHHGDSAFYRAALKGVKAHHWKFGDMPKVQGATKGDLDAIIPFIRWLQREKGVYK